MYLPLEVLYQPGTSTWPIQRCSPNTDTSVIMNFKSSLNIIPVTKSKTVEWARYFVRTRNETDTYWVKVETSEGKRLFGRHRRRWEDNTEVELQGIG